MIVGWKAVAFKASVLSQGWIYQTIMSIVVALALDSGFIPGFSATDGDRVYRFIFSFIRFMML